MCTAVEIRPLATVISLAAYRAQRAGVTTIAILSQHRPTPVPCSDVRLPDGRNGQFVTETLDGRYLVAVEGRTVAAHPDDVWLDDGPEAA